MPPEREPCVGRPGYELEFEDAFEEDTLEFPGDAGGVAGATGKYPKEFTVDYVRGYRRLE